MSADLAYYICMPSSIAAQGRLPQNEETACDVCMRAVQFHPPSLDAVKHTFQNQNLLIVCAGCAIRIHERTNPGKFDA
jgi:hypothetical protein